MNLEPYKYIDLDLNTLLASEKYLQDYTKFHNLIRKESQPDDPEEDINMTRAFFASFQNNERYALQFTFVYASNAYTSNVCDSNIYNSKETLVAILMPAAAYFESNRHAMSVNINVHRKYRQQGIAKSLLPRLQTFAEAHKRSTIFTKTQSTILAGAIFAQKIGAKVGIHNRISQLVLANISEELLHEWTNQPTLENFELGFWDGLYDPDCIEDSVKVRKAMYNAPRENLELENWEITPETLKNDQKALEKRGDKVWTVYARHKESGEMAGYSNIELQTRKPSIVQQYGTGVIPKYQGNRLGKALKATMIKRILQEYPQGKFIRTESADSNERMLEINNELGFKLYLESLEWQLNTEVLLNYIRDI